MSENDAIGSTLEGGNSFEHKCFKGIGSCVFRFRWLVLLFAHVVLIGLCFGLLDAKIITDVGELWIETGSRLRDERDLFSERFGDGTAINLVAFQALDISQTSITKPLLNEVIDTMSPILVENTLPADGNLSTDVRYDSRLILNYKWSTQTTSSSARDYTIGQLCERPPVPRVFQPVRAWAAAAVTGCGGNAAHAYIASQAFSSWSYKEINNCVRTNALANNVDLSAIFDASIRNKTNSNHTGAMVNAFMQSQGLNTQFALAFGGLPTVYGVDAFAAINQASIPWPPGIHPGNNPTSWGVQRFPCTRLSAVDCFKEGRFDYPRDLAVVDGFGFVAWQLQTNGSSSGFSSLTPALLQTLTATVQNVANVYASLNGISNWGAADIVSSQAWVAYTQPLAVTLNSYYTTCTGQTQLQIASDMQALSSAANTSFTFGGAAAAPCAAFIFTSSQIQSAQGAATGAFAFLGGVGYQWRNSMTAIENRGLSLTEYVYNGIKASRAGVPAAGCLANTLGGSNTSCCPAWSATLVPDNLVFGSPTATNIPIHRFVINLFGSGAPQYEQELFFTLNTPNSKDVLPTAPPRTEQYDMNIDFQNKWISYLDPFWKRESTTACYGANPTTYGSSCATKLNLLNYLLDVSVDDIVAEASEPEGWLVILGYVILVLYTSAAVFRLPLVYSRVSLGLAAIYYVALCVVASFGLTSLFMDLNPLSNNLAPFIGLGLGMDDAYVMIQTTTLMTKYSDNPQKRIEEVMVVAGPSVMLTSVTVAISFFVASLTPIPAVTAFVVQMGFSVILNLFGWLTIFTAIVSLDAIRIADKRKDILCCIKDEGVEDEASAVDLTGGPVNGAMSKFIVPCMKTHVGKIAILVVFIAAWVFLGIMGFTEVDEGFLISDIALKGSYQRDYTLLQEQYFGTYSNSLVTLSKTTRFEASTPACLATPPCDVSTTSGVACDGTCKQAVQLEMTLRLADLESVSRVATDLPGARIDNWLGVGSTSLLGFKTTLPSSAFGVNALTGIAAGATADESTMWTSNSYPVPPYLFANVFAIWVQGLGATSLNDIVCAPASSPTSFGTCDGYVAGSTLLEAVKTTVFTKPLITDKDFTDVITQGRDLIDSIDNANSFMAGYVFNYWDQYVGIQSKLFIIVGWALLGTFLSTLILQFSPFTSLLVVITIIKVVMECYGFIWVLGIKLNAFSLVNLTVAVGLAVEFTAHISHVFLMAKGNRNERMEFALMEMMAPMLNGMLSSFLSVVALALAKFPFFRAYYFGMFSFMIVIAFLDGMIFLPVVLSYIGPAEFSTAMSPPGAIGMKALESRPDGDDDTTAV